MKNMSLINYLAIVLFVTVTMFSITVPMASRRDEYHVLNAEEALLVWGGASPGPSLSSTSGGAAVSSSGLNITLSNVPYVTQRVLDYNNNREPRSVYYCGLASALMVRNKNAIGFTAPTLYNSSTGVNTTSIDQDLKRIDDNLKIGQYGTYRAHEQMINVYSNQGLLYISYSGESPTIQYRKTVDIVSGLYKGISGSWQSWDGISRTGRVQDVMISPMIAEKNTTADKEISPVTKEIWNHIKNNNQPVVVVVDSNKMQGYNVVSSFDSPFLHYIVIRGIKEESVGGRRKFLAYNPEFFSDTLEYSESDLLYLMALPSYTQPDWIVRFAEGYLGSFYEKPSYILKVQGD